MAPEGYRCAGRRPAPACAGGIGRQDDYGRPALQDGEFRTTGRHSTRLTAARDFGFGSAEATGPWSAADYELLIEQRALGDGDDARLLLALVLFALVTRCDPEHAEECEQLWRGAHRLMEG